MLSLRCITLCRVKEKEYTTQALLLGTHTNGEQNYLMIADVRRPIEESIIDLGKFDSTSEVGGYKNSPGKIEIKVKINHDGDVNRARYMPQNPSVIATKSSTSEVFIFDYTKHPSQPKPDGKCTPEIRLKGHTAEGFGISWNGISPGLLLSSSSDGTVCLWDVSNANGSTLDAQAIYKGHNGSVEDVAWHEFHKNYFGTVGCDGQIILYV